MYRLDFHALFVQIYTLLVGLAFGLGITILAGGSLRFLGPAFTGPRNLTEWVPLIPPWVLWGALFVILAVVMLLAMGRDLAVHVLRFGTVVYMFLAVGIVSSVLADPIASATGVMAYGSFGILHALMSVALDHEGWEGW